VGAERQFAFEQGAADTGDLGDQLRGALLEGGEVLQRRIDFGFLLDQRRPLRGDIGLFGSDRFGRRGTEHAQLHGQLRLLRQQRRGQPIDVQNERLHPVLRAFELVVIVGGRDLLLEAVEAQLKGLQIALRDAGERGADIGRAGQVGGRHHRDTRTEQRQGDEHQ